MLRIAIVLPIIMALYFGAPHTVPFQVFANWLDGFGVIVIYHLIAYGAAIAVSGVLIWLIDHRGPRPYQSTYGLVQVVRYGFVGVIVLAAVQLYNHFVHGYFGIMPLAIPVIFMIAEAAYQLVEGIHQRQRRAAWRKRAAMNPHRDQWPEEEEDWRNTP